MRRSRTLSPMFVLLLGVVWAHSAWAMPNFARKYSMSCNACHTTIPRLNEMGFQFRKAGFRMPSEIGQEAKVTLEDAFTARMQVRYDSRHRRIPGVSTTDTHQLTFHEVTLYPLSASFGKHYGSLTELSILGEDFVEIENAYFRVGLGAEKAFFSGRAGIFHPFEGYGASDRPFGLSRSFIQTQVANQNGATFFTPWGFDEAGLEAAYVYNKTSISATLFNGLFVRGDEGAFKAFPAAGGELVRRAGFSETNSKDVQLFLNQILKEDGSGASVYFYRGSVDQPRPGTSADAFTAATSFPNDFYRVAFYGSWMLVPRLGIQGAYQFGKDHFFEVATGSAGGTFENQGFFGEADAVVNEYLTFGGRYDWFDPSKDKEDNEKFGVTVFANVPLNDGLQWIAEFQHIQTKRGANLDHQKDDNVQGRLIWIW